MNSSLIRVVVDPLAGHEEEVRRTLLTRLNNFDSETIRPILMRWVRARFDIEIICLVYELSHFDDFVINAIRTIEGVEETSCHVMANGFVFPGGVALARMAREAGQNHVGATVDIDVHPGQDHAVFEQLYDLTEADDLRKYYLFKDFASAEADLTLQIIGPSQEMVDEYIQRFVRPIEGILDTHTTYTHGWAMLVSDEEAETLLAPYMPV